MCKFTKFTKFTDIKQYRNIIKDVIHSIQYDGIDENGNHIMNRNKELPTVTFKGTVKLHGSNSAVSHTYEDGLWFQSRNRKITVGKDNAGFAAFATKHQEDFEKLINTIREDVDSKENIVTVFGEWCGKGIQKNVSIANVEKRFVIFAVKVTPFSEEDSYYIDCTKYNSDNELIHNINDFKTYSVDVDFNHPELAQNKFIELVEEVEKECPVGKALGVTSDMNNVGEGIVWETFMDGKRFIFKTKGSKHSISRVKTVAAVDVEKVNSILEFVDYCVTENRLNQGIESVFTQTGTEPDIKQMGPFLKWIMGDIIKEEIDVLCQNDLTAKDVGREVSKKARVWFQTFLDKQVGL